jgi:hypothetical protein
VKPSPENLGAEAQVAWRAFLDMKASKAAHFGCLEAIETKYQAGGAPSLAENLQLEKLLAEHDRNVLVFQTAMAAVSDTDQLQALVELMS